MRKDGIVGTSLYFSPKNKEHRDTYRILSIYPRKKTEFVTCLVQKFLLENGITDIEQVSDGYLRKLIKDELLKHNCAGYNQNIFGMLSSILQNQNTGNMVTEAPMSEPPLKAPAKPRASAKPSSDKPDHDVDDQSTTYQKQTVADKEANEIDEIIEENDDTTGLTDNWMDGLGSFQL